MEQAGRHARTICGRHGDRPTNDLLHPAFTCANTIHTLWVERNTPVEIGVSTRLTPIDRMFTNPSRCGQSLPTSYRAEMPDKTFVVTVVCLGNICRSPMGAAVLRRRFDDEGLSQAVTVTSAGTSAWHVGDSADRRAAATLVAAGYDDSHSAQHFDEEMLRDSDLVVVMDESNLADAQDLSTSTGIERDIRLFRSFDPALDARDDQQVPDPYYGSAAGFERVLSMIEDASDGVVEHVRTALNESG